MRAAFFDALRELADTDHRVILLTGDLGFMAVEDFRAQFPDRFFNIGVAEQNMVGLSVGLAEAGFVPFCYSIVTFAVLRPFEFIRNGPVHHRLPVRIVGMGGGFEYGNAGPSHHGLEDIALMRCLPGLTVLAPADGAQARSVVAATARIDGPLYLRLGKDDRASVPGLGGRFELGRVQVLESGNEIAILAMGGIGQRASEAARILAAERRSVTMAIVASVAPPPVDDLRAILRGHRIVVTVEAHYSIGGLGSLVAEVASAMSDAAFLVRCAVDGAYEATTGSQRFLEARAGLSAESIADRARLAIAERA